MPVVALFAAPKQQSDVDDTIRKRHRDDLKTGVPRARVVEVPGANSDLFASHPEVVVREIRALTALPNENPR